jgi:hypothetical protein
LLQARTVTRQKPPTSKSSRENTGPVPARDREVSKAEEINALLTRPIAILPIKVGDPIRPFALGLWNEIRCQRVNATQSDRGLHPFEKLSDRGRTPGFAPP